MTHISQSTEHNDFWNHRAFKIIIGYLAGTWTFFEILKEILDRLQISPDWTFIFLYSLLLFIPGLLTFVIIPKSQNKNFSSLFRKFFPMINMVSILVFIFFLFSGKDLGAMTEEVNYVDARGANQKTKVVKESFMKNILFYKLEEEGEIDSLDQWLANGIPRAVGLNFKQFQGVQFNYNNGAEFNYYNTTESLKERLSTLSGTIDYIITGSFSSQKEKLTVNLKFYSSKGKVHESSVEAKDLFTLSDDAKQLILDITKPVLARGHIDLPFSEFVTDNLEAFKHFNNNNYTKAYNTDPDFTYAYLSEIYKNYGFGNNKWVNIELANKAMEKIGRLPEEDQLLTKSYYFLVNDQNEKAIKLFETNLSLNGHNVKVQEQYINILAKIGHDQKAIDYFDNHYQAENANSILDILVANAQTEQARALIRKMGDLLSVFDQNKYEGQLSLMDKKYDNAFAYFEKAKLEEPLSENIDSLIKVTKFMKKMGAEGLKWFGDKAEGQYFSDYSEQTHTVHFINDQLSIKYGNQSRGKIYPIDSFAYFSILSKTHRVTSQDNSSSKGNWNFVKNIMKHDFRKPKNSYYFREKEGLALGFKYFEDERYDQADSLFEKIYPLDSNYYFLKGYRDAITYMASPIKNRLPFQSTKTFEAISDGFKMYIKPSTDHYIISLSSNIVEYDRLYPTGNGWSIRVENNRRKMRFDLTEEGWVMSDYFYDHDMKAYKKADTYKEVK